MEYKPSDSAAFNNEIQHDFAFEWAMIPDGRAVYDHVIKTGVPHLTVVGKDKKTLYNGFVINRPWLYFYHPDGYLN